MSTSRESQFDSLTKLLYELKYLSRDGICLGVALMAIQACLVNEVAQFNERLVFIDQNPNLKDEIIAMTARLKQAPKPVVLTDREIKLLDVMAFLDGIELYQLSYCYPGLFIKRNPQNYVHLVSPIVVSKKLEDMGGLQRVTSWCGAYNETEFSDYFKLLNKIATDIKQPFSLLLSNNAHAIALYYDPSLGWYTIDNDSINPLEGDLAEWVNNAFKETSGFNIFETVLYLPGNAVEAKAQLKTAFDENLNFNQLDLIDEERADYRNASGATLAHIAAQRNYWDYIAVINLYDGAIDSRTYLTNESPLDYAVSQGHIDAVEVLCSAGVDVNNISKKSYTPLLIAALFGDSQVVERLLKAGAEVDAQTNSGDTSVHLAVEYNFKEVLEALIATKAKLNIPNNNGETPAAVAVQHNNVAMLMKLAEAGVDLGRQTPQATLLQIAIEYKATDCENFIVNWLQIAKKAKHARFYSPDENKASTQPEKLRRITRGGLDE